MGSLFRPGDWIAPALWCAAFGLLVIMDPLFGAGSVFAFLLAYVAIVGAVVGGAAGVAAHPPGRRAALLTIALTLGGLLLLKTVDPPTAPGALLVGLVLLVGGTRVGVAIGREVQVPGHFWPLILVAIAADIWSVAAPEGLTRAIVEGRGPIQLSLVVLSVPIPGSGIGPVLGIGDVVFTGLLVGGVAVLGLPMRRAVVGLFAGYLLCLVGLAIIQIPLPALPFIGLSTGIALGSAIRPSRRDLLTTAGFLTVMSIVALLIRG